MVVTFHAPLPVTHQQASSQATDQQAGQRILHHVIKVHHRPLRAVMQAFCAATHGCGPMLLMVLSLVLPRWPHVAMGQVAFVNSIQSGSSNIQVASSQVMRGGEPDLNICDEQKGMGTPTLPPCSGGWYLCCR
jgi:hypothetical protein